MAVELKIPQAGESVQEVQIGQWLKQEGERVERDEKIVELETDKASLDLPSPISGVITKILKPDGAAAQVGDTIAVIEDEPAPTEEAPAEDKATDENTAEEEEQQQKAPQEKPRAAQADDAQAPDDSGPEAQFVMPAAQRLLSEHGLQASDVTPSGPGGRLLKEDVLRYLEQRAEKPEDAAGSETPAPAKQQPEKPPQRKKKSQPQPSIAGPGQPEPEAEAEPEAIPEPQPAEQEAPKSKPEEPQPAAGVAPAGAASTGDRQDEVVPMTLIRRRIAETLVRAQHEAALLTTFNELDMSSVIQLRRNYREPFQTKYGVKLGFMSFFVKASIEALKEFPALNARIRQREIVYRHYYDIGIAIGGGKGLVVPALRNAERMGFAEIERQIADFAERAQANKIRPDELEGGTFTITNGGIYGSLLSTPLVNPPQSGVLGLHAIQDRPVAVEGQVVVRPMMYVALTYDHRIVDGREAVTFLRRMKEILEDPARMLLEV